MRRAGSPVHRLIRCLRAEDRAILVHGGCLPGPGFASWQPRYASISPGPWGPPPRALDYSPWVLLHGSV
jgi:hypothetical protein